MLTINIGWEFFLGIFGTLIALAYCANGRFTRVETNFDWLADAVLNKFAYRNGTSTDLLRRVGAIYLRDIAVAPN